MSAMRSVAGSGRSTADGAAAAATEAAKQALEGLKGRPAALGFVFASPRYPLDAVLAAARAAAPGAHLVGSQTAGEFTERGLTRGGVAILLLANERAELRVAAAAGVKQDAAGVAKALCAD